MSPSRPGRAAKRLVSGIVGHEAGHEFEVAVSRSHDAYRAGGIAWIDQLPVPTSPVRGDVAQLVATRLGAHKVGGLRQQSRRQGYDFFGFFGPEAGPQHDPRAWYGLAIAMEAKRSSDTDTALPIAVEKADSKGHVSFGPGLRLPQMQALAAAYRDWGVISAVVWHNGEKRLVLTPDVLLRVHDAYMSGEGRKSIPVSDFQPYDVVDYPRHASVHDWLFVLRCWLEKHGPPSACLSKRKTYPMIMHRIDYHAGVVTADRADGTHIHSDGKKPRLLNERGLIEQLARECKDADEFIAKVNTLEAADEGQARAQTL